MQGAGLPGQSRGQNGGRRQQEHASKEQQRQFESFAKVTEAFGGESVRVRILDGKRSVGTAVVERDKFVESLDRLVLRHGYVTGGRWKVLAQVNASPSDDFYQPEGGNYFLDLLEKGVISALQQVASLTTGSHAQLVTLTPLAIYRELPTHA